MENFKSFITEKKDKIDKITVLILTSSALTKPEIVTGMLMSSCKKFGLNCYQVITSEAWISDNDIEKGKIVIKNHNGKDEDIEIETTTTVVFVRAGTLDTEIGSALLNTLQNFGCFMINTNKAMVTCNNKMSAYTSFERNGINTPRTSLVNNEKSILDAHKRIGGKFPVIIKTLTGTQGVGVSKVENMESLVSVIQSLWKFDAYLLIQEFLEIKFDIRTVVLNGRIIASTKRIKPKEDFRSNRHLGAETEAYILNDNEKKIIIAAARATGAYMVGVDHAIHKGKIYVLECNGSPGLGSQFQDYDITKIPQEPSKKSNIIDFVIEYLQNPLHRLPSFDQEAGYHESIEVEGYGLIRAKFDTGNGTKASMFDVDKIDIKGRTVKWEKDGKKFTNKLIGISKPTHVGKIDERPIVHVSIKFNNMIYPNVPIGLSTKDSASTFLVNRDLLTRFRVTVNPKRKFLLSSWLAVGDKTDIVT
jgi:ribosomal protein S6--L-glutamate ligase